LVDKDIEYDIIKCMKIPSEYYSQGGIPPDVLDTVGRVIAEFEREYTLNLNDVVAESMGSENQGVVFQYRPLNKSGATDPRVYINTDYNFDNLRFALKRNFEGGVLSERTIDELVRHELAHALTFQGVPLNRLNAFNAELNEEFVRGVSLYSDRLRDGAEAIAEAFTKLERGESVPEEAKLLVERLIYRWRKK
jgi:hypothetical protein